MPIHDLGYRKWQGVLTSPWSRWSVITETGLRRVWQSTWVRRIIFFAWLPLLLFALVFLLYEWAARGGMTQMFILDFFGQFDFASNLRGIRPGPDANAALKELRHDVWLRVLLAYFRYPQGIALVLLIGLIAPRLISEDVSSRAFLFYFSRPLKRFEYILGKSATVWVFLSAITTLPALFMYLMAIALSASPQVALDTWDIPLRILGASFVVIIPASAISLCFSSLTRDSRYAGFAWFALWTMGIVSWGFVGIWRLSQESDNEAIWGDGLHRFEEYFSIHHIFGAVQRWVFGLESLWDVKGFVLILGLATLFSIVILFRRVSSPMRA
ncbi:MAG: ABC transporter permease [Planctomycetaceae bacterium]